VALLVVDRLNRSFRGLRAVVDVSFEVAANSIAALIGPNGAGKTTTFNLIAGMLRPDSGEIRLGARRISGLRPDQACVAGLGRTFQLVKPFEGMTVLDNVVVGALVRERHVAAARRRAREVLERLDLAALADTPAAHLTLADRRRLEIARALATRPALLLLDEVMAGLRPKEIDEMVAILQAIRREEGTTLLLTEHVMRAVMALAEEMVVLHHGQVVARGAPASVVKEPAVLECYLGEEAVPGC
jgi:branched-chain amino acid transport system ATP-binding protein